MLKLKLQYFGQLMRRANSLEKILMLGKIEGKEKGTTEDEMVGWHHWLNARVWASSGRWWRRGKTGVLQSMGSQRIRHNQATEQPPARLCWIQCNINCTVSVIRTICLFTHADSHSLLTHLVIKNKRSNKANRTKAKQTEEEKKIKKKGKRQKKGVQVNIWQDDSQLPQAKWNKSNLT